MRPGPIVRRRNKAWSEGVGRLTRILKRGHENTFPETAWYGIALASDYGA